MGKESFPFRIARGLYFRVYIIHSKQLELHNIKMRESELITETHRSHALEWRSDDTCLLCLMEIIRGDSSSRLKIHRRFALATFNQRIDPDVTRPSFQQDNGSSKNLARLLQKNHNVSSQVLSTLLGMQQDRN